jgi:hypothetical protein
MFVVASNNNRATVEGNRFFSMDSVIERQRQLHEDIEFLEKNMVTELIKEHQTHKEKINSEHRVRRMMEVRVLSHTTCSTAHTAYFVFPLAANQRKEQAAHGALRRQRWVRQCGFAWPGLPAVGEQRE